MENDYAKSAPQPDTRKALEDLIEAANNVIGDDCQRQIANGRPTINCKHCALAVSVAAAKAALAKADADR